MKKDELTDNKADGYTPETSNHLLETSSTSRKLDGDGSSNKQYLNRSQNRLKMALDAESIADSINEEIPDDLTFFAKEESHTSSLQKQEWRFSLLEALYRRGYVNRRP